jgi:hypothetical protein
MSQLPPEPQVPNKTLVAFVTFREREEWRLRLSGRWDWGSRQREARGACGLTRWRWALLQSVCGS